TSNASPNPCRGNDSDRHRSHILIKIGADRAPLVDGSGGRRSCLSGPPTPETDGSHRPTGPPAGQPTAARHSLCSRRRSGGIRWLTSLTHIRRDRTMGALKPWHIVILVIVI